MFRNNPVRHGLVKDPDDWPFQIQSVMNDLGLKTSVRADDRELDPSLRIWPFPGVAPVRRSSSAKLEMMTSRLCSSGNQVA
jgi:hypothetical protein